jgi:hypothetical protein
MRNAVTSLRRRQTPMRAYDALPPELRGWAQQAALPWSAQSLARVWKRALRDAGGNTEAALDRMAAAEARSLARDAPRIWGARYPTP